jgi:N-acetyl-alpha-D-muramate 1-phosphate uridylyltransferase
MTRVPFAAMILAAGRGERMRPLSDATPKPLLAVGGQPLIIWQIEALARAGFRDIVINVSHLGKQIEDALGNGSAFGVAIRYSREKKPLDAGGGIATALPLLTPGPALIVSGDIWTQYDYARLVPRAQAMTADPSLPRAHLVMVPTQPYHPQGDFALHHGMLALDGGPKLVYGNIGLHDTALFRELPPSVPLKLLPLWQDWIRRGMVSGELFEGSWANVGTPAELASLDATLYKAARLTRPGLPGSIP